MQSLGGGRGAVFVLALVALAGFCVYFQTFSYPFHYDDFTSITQNPATRHLEYFADPSAATGIAGAHTPQWLMMLRSRYLGALSFALNYRFGGLDVRGYHVVNFLIHVAASLGVFALVRISFHTPFLSGSWLVQRGELIAALCALLFVSHPVNTQAVTYIAQRYASMAAMFYFWAMTAYIQWRISGERGMYWRALLLTACAMLTKQSAFTLPLALALYEGMFFGAAMLRGKRLLAVYGPFAAVTVAAGVFLFPQMMGAEGLGTGVATMSPVDYLLTEQRVLWTYVRLMVLPFNQSLSYSYPVYSSLLAPAVLVSLASMIALACFVYRLFRVSAQKDPGLRLICFGLCWFFVAMMVESSVFVLEPINEHRLYLALPGFILAVVVAGHFVARWVGGAVGVKALSAGLAALVVVSSLLAYNRNSVWASDEALWSDVASKRGGGAVALCNLGTAYGNGGQTEQARKCFEEAIAQDPGNAVAHNNMGLLSLRTGDMDGALRHLRIAVELDPSYDKASAALGEAYMELGLYRQARHMFQRAVEASPYRAENHNNLGVAYALEGMEAHARQSFLTALSLEPGDDRASNNLARLRIEAGQPVARH